MIQLYNVPATNRLNLLANSTPQKTITVVEASLKVVIMLPFRVPGLASQLRQEKWELFFIFLPLHSLGIWTVKMVKHWDTREKREGWDWGSKNSNRKNDKGFVNYALWEGKFSETKWSKGWSRGNELRGERGGCQCKSLLLCVRTKRDNILCELCVFAPLGGTIYDQLAEEISNVETCSNLQSVVIRLSGAQHPSAQLSPGELGMARWLVFALGAFPHGGQTSGMQPGKLH